MQISVLKKTFFSLLLYFTCFLFAFFSFGNKVVAQNKATVYGKIEDKQTHEGIEFVSVSVIGLPGATQTDKDGKYVIEVPADRKITLAFSHISFQTYMTPFFSGSPDSVLLTAKVKTIFYLLYNFDLLYNI